MKKWRDKNVSMRIGIDIRTLMDEKYSGIPEYSFCIINEIIRQDRGNEYVLFYNSFKDLSDRIGEFSYDNVKIVKTSYPNKIFSYLLQKFLAWPKLDRLLNVDVFFMPHLGFASFSGKAKTAITIHDLSFLPYTEFYSTRKNIWHKMLNVKKNLKKFDKIIAVSDNTKQDLIELCGISSQKIDVVYSGISQIFKIEDKNSPELKRVKEKYKLPDKFVLFLGTIEPRKNVEGLILAYEKLMDENPELSHVYLVIAGAKGWKYAKTIESYEKSRYKDKIVLTGYVDKADKAIIYNLADIFIYPSFYEGFGFPPLEAMACGVPCIVSANSSMTEILDNSAVFVDPYNISNLRDAMRELLVSNNLRTKLIKEGLIVSKRYEWSLSASKTLDILKNLYNTPILKEKLDNT